MREFIKLTAIHMIGSRDVRRSVERIETFSVSGLHYAPVSKELDIGEHVSQEANSVIFTSSYSPCYVKEPVEVIDVLINQSNDDPISCQVKFV